MDFGVFFFIDWPLAVGFIVGVGGIVGLVGGAVTLLAVPADHPALKPPANSGDEQLELPFDQRDQVWTVLELL